MQSFPEYDSTERFVLRGRRVPLLGGIELSRW